MDGPQDAFSIVIVASLDECAVRNHRVEGALHVDLDEESVNGLG